MPKRWPQAWHHTAHKDRLDEQGRRVSVVILKSDTGVEVEAGMGDIIKLKKDSKTTGVIDRITPSRVRVLVGDKYGNYNEDSLLFHKRGGVGRTEEPQQQQATEVKQEHQSDTQEEKNAEVIAFFKEMEVKILNYTNAAVEMYLMMEMAKVKFTQGAGRYEDHTDMIREEFRVEALRRVTEFQQFVDQVEEKLKH
jgi:hypothetical protein